MAFSGEIDQLFDTSIQHNSPGFALGKSLAALHPELARIEGELSELAFRGFAAAGHCRITLRPDLYNQIESRWSSEHGIVDSSRNAWLRVEWDGTTFDVVIVTWPSHYGSTFYQVVMGPTRQRCEELVDACCRWNSEIRGEILVFSHGCFSKSEKLFRAIDAASFDQLVLQGALKDQLRADFTEFLTSRELYETHGVPWKRGALLIGPPGNGKTLCVKALVNLLKIPCIYVQSFESEYNNVQGSIEKVFARARATTPCLLVLEDLDSLIDDKNRSFFLNELDGFASNTGVITLATTNHPDRLDPAIVERPSRFDRKYHFLLPDPATRAAYVALWNERLRMPLRVGEAGMTQIVEQTEGFSFAYIQEVFVSSTMRWMSNQDPGGILSVALEQVATLRAQMKSPATP